jgi:hypothetical protein
MLPPAWARSSGGEEAERGDPDHPLCLKRPRPSENPGLGFWFRNYRHMHKRAPCHGETHCLCECPGHGTYTLPRHSVCVFRAPQPKPQLPGVDCSRGLLAEGRPRRAWGGGGGGAHSRGKEAPRAGQSNNKKFLPSEDRVVDCRCV